MILSYCLLKHMFLIFYVIFVSLILFVFIIHLVSNHHIYLAVFFGPRFENMILKRSLIEMNGQRRVNETNTLLQR